MHRERIAEKRKGGSVWVWALCLEGFALAFLGLPAYANSQADALLIRAAGEASKGQVGSHKALEYVNKALTLEPRNATGWCLKSQVLGTMEESELALPCISRAVQIEPKNSFLWLQQANVLCQLGKYEQALKSVDTAIKLKNVPEYHAVRAKVLRYLGKLQMAEQELDRLVTGDPKNAVYRMERCKLGRMTKSWSKVVDDLTVLIEADREASSPRGGQIGKPDRTALVSGSSTKGAAGVASAPGLGRYENLLERAEAYTELKQWDKAIADYKTGLKEHPDMRQYHVGLLKVYTLKGDKKAAREEQALIDSFDDDFKPGKWSHD